MNCSWEAENSKFHLFSYHNLFSKYLKLEDTTHYFIMKIPNKRDLQQIASNRLSDTEFNDFMRLYKDYTKEPLSFLVKDWTLPWDNTRKNLL